jgi:hypothetical protein
MSILGRRAQYAMHVMPCNVRFCYILRPFHPLSSLCDIQQTYEPANKPNVYDLITVGGGPVELVLAYQLTRLGITTLCQSNSSPRPNNTCTDAHAPSTRERSRRSTNLACWTKCSSRPHRTLKRCLQRRPASPRSWLGFVSRMNDTYLDYCLNIRWKYSEVIFRSALE